jgi:thiamine-phosphate pyrophosphorylase
LILHLVTSSRRLCGAGAGREEVRRCLLQQARHAVDAGVDVIQIREPDLDARDLAELVAGIAALARGSSTRIIVNDRLDVAVACGAHGVHLRGDSILPATARSIVPHGFTVGRSVHGVEEAVAVARDVDYLIAGTVWSTESKRASGSLLGLAGLAAVAAAVHVPVLAIGGVAVDRLAQVASAGAAGVAAIGLFIGPEAASEAGACRAASLREVVVRARRRFDRPSPPS